MGFRDNFSAQDLTAANLPALIADLKSAVASKEYDSIEEFATDFATVVSGMEISVGPDGKRSLVIGDELVDFDSAVKDIVSEINKVKTHSVTSRTRNAILNMYKAVDVQLSGLFKQHEMMQELLSRGFDPAEFEKNIDKSNEESKNRIKAIEGEQKKSKGIKEKMFGKDSDITGTTSLLTQKELLKNGAEAVNLVRLQLNEIQDLIDAINQIKLDIRSGAITDERGTSHIASNQSKIASLEANIRGELKVIKDCKISGLDLGTIEDAVSEDTRTRTVTINDAIYAMDFVGSRGASMEDILDSEIHTNYDKIGKAIVKNDKKLVDPDKSLISGGDVTAIDKYLKELEEKEEKLEKDKSREELLIIAREKSLADYKDKHQKFADAKSKLKYVQDKDADGNLLYYEDDGHGNPDLTKPPVTTVTPHIKPKMVQAKDGADLLFIGPDGRPTKTDTGTPYMVPQMEAVDPTSLMAGFDEATKKSEIDASAEITGMWDTEIAKLGWNKKRTVLKAAGIGNPLTRLFRAIPKLDSNDANIRTAVMNTHNAPAIDTKRKELLDAAKKTHLDTETSKIVETYEETKGVDEAFASAYESIAHSANVHKKMQDGAYKVVEHNKKTDKRLINTLRKVSFSELALVYGRALLDPDQQKQLDEEHDFAETIKRETKVASNPRTPEHHDIIFSDDEGRY